MDLTIINICLIIIVSVIFIKGVFTMVLMLKLWRLFKSDIRPVLDDSKGLLNSATSLLESTKENVDNINVAVQDVAYKTREVTDELQNKVIPLVRTFGASVSGASHVISFLMNRFGRKK